MNPLYWVNNLTSFQTTRLRQKLLFSFLSDRGNVLAVIKYFLQTNSFTSPKTSEYNRLSVQELFRLYARQVINWETNVLVFLDIKYF